MHGLVGQMLLAGPALGDVPHGVDDPAHIGDVEEVAAHDLDPEPPPVGTAHPHLAAAGPPRLGPQLPGGPGGLIEVVGVEEPDRREGGETVLAHRQGLQGT